MEFKRPVEETIGASVAPKSYDHIMSGVASLIDLDAKVQTSNLLAAQDAEMERQINEGAEAKKQELEARGVVSSPDGQLLDPNHPAVQAGPVGAVFPENVAPAGDYPLSGADKKFVDSIGTAMRSNATGLYQGATSFEQSYINQDLILKRAISKRPWLKQELINASKGFLGVDVYQRGYSALADSEAARMRALEKRQEGAVAEAMEEGKRLRENGALTAMMGLVPPNEVAFLLKATDVQLAEWWRANEGTPMWQQATTIASAANVAKAQSAATQAQLDINKNVGEITQQQTVASTNAGVLKVLNAFQNDPNAFDAQGMLTPQGREALLTATENARRTVLTNQAALSVQTGMPASDAFAPLLTLINDVQADATGENSAKLTKAMIGAKKAQIEAAFQANPYLQSIYVAVIKGSPELAQTPDVAMQRAYSIAGGDKIISPASAEVILAEVTSTARGVTSMAQLVQQQKGSQEALVTVQTLQNGVIGTLNVVGATSAYPNVLGNSQGAMANVQRTLLDTGMALNSTGIAPGTTILTSMSGTGAQDVAVAYSKAVYTGQQGLVTAPRLDPALARLAGEAVPGSGKSRILFKPDGSVQIAGWNDLPNKTPAEVAYFNRVQSWNNDIFKAGTPAIMKHAYNGKAPDWNFANAVRSAPLLRETTGPYAAPYPRVGLTTGGAPTTKKPQPPQGGAQGNSSTKGSKGFSLRDYAKGVQRVESSHNPDAVVGRKDAPAVSQMTLGEVMAYQSSLKGNTAVGLYQFTESSLKQAMKDAGVEEGDRFDVPTQNKLFKAWTSRMQKAGEGALNRPLDNVETYIMHWAGEGAGPKLLRAPDNAPLAEVVGEDVLAGNPTYAKAKTVGGLKALLEKKLAP